MQGPDEYAWTQLGRYLEQRRVELDTRYRNLTLFCQDKGIDYRLAWDIEHARRTNYRRTTLLALESAYGLRAGRIQDYLAKAQITAAAEQVLDEALDEGGKRNNGRSA